MKLTSLQFIPNMKSIIHLFHCNYLAPLTPGYVTYVTHCKVKTYYDGMSHH